MTTSVSETHIFVGHDLIRQAHARIRPFVRETGVERAPLLESGDGAVWLKLELQQVTGSFKVRGALNAMSAVAEGPSDRARRVVASSAGNHALGIAFGSQVSGVPATVFVPDTVDPSRRRALEGYPVELKIVPGGYGGAEAAALSAAREPSVRFISPYNDPLVIAGQGTVGLELLQQVPDIDAVIIAVGGGGLLAGIGSYVRAMRPDAEIIAVSPARSAVMCDRLAGRTVPCLGNVQTLSDSTAGDIQEGSITVDLCRALIDRWVVLAEEEIVAAMKYLFYEHRLVAEGAGALAVGAYSRERDSLKDRNCALVVCGGNIEPERFLGVIGRG